MGFEKILAVVTENYFLKKLVEIYGINATAGQIQKIKEEIEKEILDKLSK